METQKLNLFIVDNNNMVAEGLRQELIEKYGPDIDLKVFHDEQTCLNNLSKEVDILMMVSPPYEKKANANGIEIIKAMQDINPKTRILTHIFNGDMGTIIESFRLGKGTTALKEHKSARIAMFINRYITDPIRILVKEFRVSKFMGIFMLTFLSVLLVVVLVLKYIWKH